MLSSGYTKLTRPHSRALCAGIRSPSSAIWKARDLPTAAGTNSVEPPSGIRPMFTNARPKKADSAASTRSQARASEQPMPTAGPFTRDDRLRQAADARDRRVVDVVELLLDVRVAVLGMGVETGLQVCAAAEATPGARDHDRAHAGVGGLAQDDVAQRG